MDDVQTIDRPPICTPMSTTPKKNPNSRTNKPQSIFDEANEVWEAGNAVRAFSLFNAAASAGEFLAFNSVGYFLDHGIGVAKDSVEALSWYKRAARSGDPCAYSNIGLSYRNAGNMRLAKAWLRKAMECGDGDAALELAKLYLSNPAKRNRKLAWATLRLARESESITEFGREECNTILQQLSSAT
ncbi:MAG: tetratricopeptide repeat protein [Betaproteobacteria bacterium]